MSTDKTTDELIDELANKGEDLTEEEVEILYDWVLAEKKKLEE